MIKKFFSLSQLLLAFVVLISCNVFAASGFGGSHFASSVLDASRRDVTVLLKEAAQSKDHLSRFLAAGNSLNMRDELGNSVLHYVNLIDDRTGLKVFTNAVNWLNVRVECEGRLLPNNRGESFLHRVIFYWVGDGAGIFGLRKVYQRFFVKENQEDFARLIGVYKRCGGSLNDFSIDQGTPFFYAIGSAAGQIAFAIALADAGADTTIGLDGITPLGKAIDCYAAPLVERLFRSGATIRWEDKVSDRETLKECIIRLKSKLETAISSYFKDVYMPELALATIKIVEKKLGPVPVV